MKHFKKITALTLCLAAAASLTACGEGGANTTTAATTTTTANTLDDDKNNPVDISGVVEAQEEKKTLENPNLTYFGFYDMRVAGDIKPGVKLFEETYGGKIDYYECSWGERVEKLQTLIISDDAPDLVDKEDNSFPHLMSKNIYEDLTKYIDLTQPQWDGYADLIESYIWNGAHYYYPFTATALSNCLIYNNKLFEEYGLDDPKELYDNGTWTWTEFRDVMINFVKQAGDSAVGGIQGLVGTDIMLSTGTPLIGLDDSGKIVNNMASPSIERAAAFLEEIRKDVLPVRGDGMWSNESAPIVDGKVAFLGVGTWKLSDLIKHYPEVEWGIVPFPRDPSADEYYTGASNFGYMVPAGSQNVEGAATFIDIMRRCQTDPELKAIIKESVMNDKKYTDEQYDFLTSFENIGDYHMVVNMAYGFNSDTSTIIDDLLTNVAFAQDDSQLSWSALRSSYETLLNETIDTYNATLAS